MEVCIISVGKVSTDWIKDGISRYEPKIQKYIKCVSLVVPDIKNSSSLSRENIKDEEGNAIITKLTPSDYVVLLDEKGTEMTSRGFSEWFQKQMNSGKKRIVLIIGGPYGFSESVYSRANAMISLSKMTFTHEMAKLILTEQIYRAMTILRGEPYHHD